MSPSTRQTKRRLRELSLWCRQLGMMLRTGTDLVAALTIIEHQDFSPDLRDMTTAMIEQAAGDITLEDLIASRTDIFPPVAGFALKAGQARQRAPETLVTLADCLEQAAELGMDLSLGNGRGPSEEPASVDQMPVVRIVDSIIREAVNAGATEIHVRTSDDGEHAHVFYTVSGAASVVAELPAGLIGPICRRICIMASINWHLQQPALGMLQIGQRDGDPHGTVRFIPGEREADCQVHVNLTAPSR